MSIYDFSAIAKNGQEKSLADFNGKVVLIVNTAGKCGFTYHLFSKLRSYFPIIPKNKCP